MVSNRWMAVLIVENLSNGTQCVIPMQKTRTLDCLWKWWSFAGMRLMTPNVRAKRATTVGRQARAGENVPRTTGPGLVACRWRSA